MLAPGVALAHAQPDGSVTHTAMSAMTVPEGVSFGHDGNDPVRLVLCLAAADSTSHLEAQSLHETRDASMLCQAAAAASGTGWATASDRKIWRLM